MLIKLSSHQLNFTNTDFGKLYRQNLYLPNDILIKTSANARQTLQCNSITYCMSELIYTCVLILRVSNGKDTSCKNNMVQKFSDSITMGFRVSHQLHQLNFQLLHYFGRSF